MKKYAYVTLLSSKDYLEAVLVLNYSLQLTKSKYPLIVACTSDVFNDKQIIKILNQEKIIVEQINKIEYNQQTKQNLKIYQIPSLLKVGSKIEIFSLIQYDKLIYLDADSLIVKNIDSLFYKRDGSTLIDEFGQCFCAMFVFKPKNHSIKRYKELLEYTICNDGSLLGDLWFHVKDNPYYHISNRYFYISLDETLKFNVKAYHLQKTSMKYWKNNNFKTPLGKLYLQYLQPIREKYKQEFSKILFN